MYTEPSKKACLVLLRRTRETIIHRLKLLAAYSSRSADGMKSLATRAQVEVYFRLLSFSVWTLNFHNENGVYTLLRVLLFQAAVVPGSLAHPVRLLVSLLFDMPCNLLPNFLAITLSPSNQIIHPARYKQTRWGLGFQGVYTE